jgi:hypothetical protein
MVKPWFQLGSQLGGSKKPPVKKCTFVYNCLFFFSFFLGHILVTFKKLNKNKNKNEIKIIIIIHVQKVLKSFGRKK